MTSKDLSEVRRSGDDFRAASQALPNETLETWRNRLEEDLSHHHSLVPKSVIQLAQLIAESVASLVSIAVWGHSLNESQVSTTFESERFENAPTIGLSLSDDSLAFQSVGSSIRLRTAEGFSGIGKTVGSSFQISHGQMVKSEITIVRLRTYEH